ncbi:MAG: hypothetical protein AMJ43_11395 [Coxiella sp. DG_40]|nr:MAG: hypothetical protein AMJ43_11395 [Coxiella sp. DG_40]
MGLDITYVAGEKEFSFGLSPTDVEVMQTLAQKGLKQEVEVIIGVLDFDVMTSINGKLLLESVSLLLEIIKKSQILPYTYSFKIERPPGSGNYSTGSGLASGIRIHGELYSIQGGLDRCELIRDWWDEGGVYHGDKPKDIRSLKKITTDSHGEIIIRKTKKPTCLIQNLKRLKTFLSKNDVNIIQKILG